MTPVRARAIAVSIALLAACTESGSSSSTPTTDTKTGAASSIVILATGDVGGDTEECGCKARRMGGLARRAKIVRDTEAAHPGRTIVVDAGDLLVKTPLVGPRDEPQARETAAVLAESMKKMRAPVMAVGERDLALGLGTLRRLAAKNEITLLAANLVHTRTGTRAFEPFAIVERGGEKIAFVGAALELDPKSPAYAVYTGANLEIRTTETAIAEAAREARKKGAVMVVGLFHLGIQRTKEVMSKLDPGLVDLAIIAHDRQASSDLEPMGTSALIASGERGKWLLSIDVRLTPGAKGVRNVGAIEAAKMSIAEIDQRIAAYERADAGVADPTIAAKIAGDQRATIERLKKRRAQIEADLATVPADPRHLLKAELIPLDIALPEDAEMLAALNAYKDRLNIVNAATGVVPTANGEAKVVYTGTATCKNCHAPAYKHWIGTKHAEAWTTMEKTRQTGNLDCIPCHTTGFDRPGGPSGLAGLTRFVAVGCESCHGAGSAHAERPEVRTSFDRAAMERVCAECHRAQADQKPFELADRLPKILGPGHGAPAAVRKGAK